jgi:phenylacetic acid degradation operon negative regulatory protein
MAGSIRFLMAVGAAGGEVSGVLAHALWKNISPSARLDEAYRRLRLAGQIEFHGTGPLDARVIRLTAEGHRTCLGTVDPEPLWARNWDGLWRIVAFDIPETNACLRVRLRRRLHAYRFGWLQNSVWISPDPIDEFRARLSEKNLLPESLTLLEAHPAGGESNEAFVTSAWDFDALDKCHTHYLEVLHLRPNRLQQAAAWLSWLETERRAWQQIAKRDPFLPRELHPRTYRGPAVWQARQEAFAACGTALR